VTSLPPAERLAMYRSRQPVHLSSREHESRAGHQHVLKRTDTRERLQHAVLRGMFRSLQRTGRPTMPLIQLVEVLIVVGVLLWLVNRFIPMAGSVKSILNAVVVIALVVWVLRVAGLWDSLARIRVG
jgi:Flp pilus assembly protein TadB